VPSERPSASFSVTIKITVPNRPGSLARVASAIGDNGGDIVAIDVVESHHDFATDEITVNAIDDKHAQRIRRALERLGDGYKVHSVTDRTFRLHHGGKIEVKCKSPITNRDDLSMAYTPGVARVSKAIAEDPSLGREFTIKRNTVAVVTDGTAVLGLGNIGPLAALPVMEGKAALFKEFAGVDAFPICLDTTDVDEIVETTIRIAPVFGGINLEDISAPRCFEVEELLRQALDIPVFHDDQHGTAVVVLAALRNALEIVDKKMTDISVVIAGAGAAGVATAQILRSAGVPEIILCDRGGILHPDRDDLNRVKRELADWTNPRRIKGSLSDAMVGTDVFIGVSGPDLVSRTDVEAMAKDPIVFALANPDPEIRPEAIRDIAAVIATGRSDYPNQINNVLCFPAMFRGALDAGATEINEEMKLAAADAIAACVRSEELNPDYIVPSVFNKQVVPVVAKAVYAAAHETRVATKE
jgi:malate dehydrogenase (oxaloacetate-decarboxylating)